jgi:two-component system sensor histidine kinase KdpD
VSDVPREPREPRPSPDAILERLRKEELGAVRGKLRLFFGFAPGVGKTMRMLEVAHALVAKGKDDLTTPVTWPREPANPEG